MCWLCNYTQVHIYGFTPLPNLEDLRKPRGMGLSLWVCTIKQVHISSKQLLKLFQCCITCYCINISNVGGDHNNKTIKVQRGGPIIYRTMSKALGLETCIKCTWIKILRKFCNTIKKKYIDHSFFFKKFEDPW